MRLLLLAFMLSGCVSTKFYYSEYQIGCVDALTSRSTCQSIRCMEGIFAKCEALEEQHDKRRNRQRP